MEVAVAERFDRIEDLVTQLIKGNAAFRAEMFKRHDELQADVEDLRIEVGGIRTEVVDLRTEVGDLRTDLKATEERLTKAINAVHNELTDYIRDESYQKTQFTVRLTRVENRVAEIEKEYRAKETSKSTD